MPAGWLVPDRNDPALGADFDQRLEQLAGLIADLPPDGPLRFVGFSLGAMVALRLAPRLGARVAAIDLISPAAPLEGGDFLTRMAGGPVFKLACNWPVAFSALSLGQALLARIAPRWLARQLFVSARGEDAELAGSERFLGAIAAVLGSGLGRSSQAYRCEIAAYVKPWAEDLPNVRAPVAIWQGQDDNWTPPDMAEYLARNLPGPVTLHRLEGHSHYSTLGYFLAQSGR